MAIRPKDRIGTADCLCCGREVPVKQAENKTLSMPCHWCDFPAYAKAGTESHRIMSGKVRRDPPAIGEAQQAPKAPAQGVAIATPIQPKAPTTKAVRGLWGV